MRRPRLPVTLLSSLSLLLLCSPALAGSCHWASLPRAASALQGGQTRCQRCSQVSPEDLGTLRMHLGKSLRRAKLGQCGLNVAKVLVTPVTGLRDKCQALSPLGTCPMAQQAAPSPRFRVPHRLYTSCTIVPAHIPAPRDLVSSLARSHCLSGVSFVAGAYQEQPVQAWDPALESDTGAKSCLCPITAVRTQRLLHIVTTMRTFASLKRCMEGLRDYSGSLLAPCLASARS